jgi:hypothetical protein
MIMSSKARKEYKAIIRKRYQQSDKAGKTAILDEFCSNCGYHRKYAIRILNEPPHQVKKKRRGRPRVYEDPVLIDVLKQLWLALNQPCSKRLQPAIPLWLPHYEKHTGQQLPEHIQAQLYRMSSATIDRLLAPSRSHWHKLGLSTTKPGSILKVHIPVKTSQWDETRPGYLEADTVAHCGTSAAGSFIYTLNTVDIATGWTEQRAIWEKGYRNVHLALIDIEAHLPFELLGFDCDNGSEFLNWHIHKHFCKRPRPVDFTRSRPYQKNDNAHIEEKNWTLVRQYLGYNRFDRPEWVEQLNAIYTTEWRLLMNFFRPTMKLIRKTRDGAQVRKGYDAAQTPLQRVLKSEYVSDAVKEQLLRQFEQLDPFQLYQQMVIKIRRFLVQTTPVDSHYVLTNVE